MMDLGAGNCGRVMGGAPPIGSRGGFSENRVGPVHGVRGAPPIGVNA
jgi:hypothetical protein